MRGSLLKLPPDKDSRHQMNDDDLRHYDRIRENHDITQDWLDREEELDRWLGWAIAVLAFLGLWKIIELAWAIAMLASALLLATPNDCQRTWVAGETVHLPAGCMFDQVQ